VSNFQMIAMVCLLIGIILVVRYDDFHQNKRIVKEKTDGNQ